MQGAAGAAPALAATSPHALALAFDAKLLASSSILPRVQEDAQVQHALNLSFAANCLLLAVRVGIATIAGSLSLVIATLDAFLDVISSGGRVGDRWVGWVAVSGVGPGSGSRPTWPLSSIHRTAQVGPGCTPG